MISVKCDMCGKDITNDTERTIYRFPHKVYRDNEETISDYDICGECSNKIEEFIKSSHKNRKSPLYSDTCFKLTEEEAAEQDELDSIHDTFCEVRKKAIDKILDRACEGKMCYKFGGRCRENCSDIICSRDLPTQRYEFSCIKKGRPDQYQ